MTFEEPMAETTCAVMSLTTVDYLQTPGADVVHASIRLPRARIYIYARMLSQYLLVLDNCRRRAFNSAKVSCGTLSRSILSDVSSSTI